VPVLFKVSEVGSRSQACAGRPDRFSSSPTTGQHRSHTDSGWPPDPHPKTSPGLPPRESQSHKHAGTMPAEFYHKAEIRVVGRRANRTSAQCTAAQQTIHPAGVCQAACGPCGRTGSGFLRSDFRTKGGIRTEESPRRLRPPDQACRRFRPRPASQAATTGTTKVKGTPIA